MHIHAVYAELCCARPRIFEPFKLLSTIEGVMCSASTCATQPDILIQQRARSISMESQRWLFHRGVLLVAELDDHPDGLQGYRENDYIQLRAVHAVQVSTEPLAQVVRQYNPNVAVFENQIAELLEPPTIFSEGDDTTIFYGAQNRQSDWAPIMPALNRVLRERPLMEVQVIHDREFFDALDTETKAFTPFCEYGRYRKILRCCDIALLPLEPGPFNECKSDLKFLECAAEGVAVLASETVYAHTILTNMKFAALFTNGFVYGTPDQFAAYLTHLIKTPEKRKEVTTNAYAYIRDHRMLSQHYESRYMWYEALLRSKSSLDKQLLERVPSLARPQPALPGLRSLLPGVRGSGG